MPIDYDKSVCYNLWSAPQEELCWIASSNFLSNGYDIMLLDRAFGDMDSIAFRTGGGVIGNVLTTREIVKVYFLRCVCVEQINYTPLPIEELLK